MSSIKVTNLQFAYQQNQTILNIHDFSVGKSERVFLYGPSGCGKTTLLGLLAGILPSPPGSVQVLGKDLGAMSSAQRDQLRGTSIGYVFQIFNLIPYLSVLDNITLPTLFGRRVSEHYQTSIEEARALANGLGIESLLNRGVEELSIGQQQRVAAARALIGSPGLVLADEPTSALDADARGDFLEVLFAQAKREGAAVLFVSHDRSLASKFDREVSLPTINAAKGARP